MSENKKFDIVRIAGEKIDLCIRRTDEEAFEKYLKWMNDASINHWIGRFNQVVQINDERAWIEKEENGRAFFNIVNKETRELVGNCDIIPVAGTRNASIGICIGEESGRDKGFGTEAVKLLIKFGFENLGCHRIYLHVKADNDRAIKCYQNAGFVKCGIMHEVDYYQGKYHDALEMEILEQSYFKNKED